MSLQNRTASAGRRLAVRTLTLSAALALAAGAALTPWRAARGDGEHSLIKSHPYHFVKVDGKAGSWPGMGSDTLNFTIKTTVWRIRLKSEQGEGNKGRIRMNLWAAEDQNGKTIYRSMGSIFDAFAGDEFEQIFNANVIPGTYADGSPRPFRLAVSGTRVNYEVIVEDASGPDDAPATPPSPGDDKAKNKPAPPAKKK